MFVRFGRVAVALLLIWLVNVRPAVSAVPSLLRPITSASKMVTKTAKKVTKTSVNTLNTVVSAPKKLFTSVGNTLTGKGGK